MELEKGSMKKRTMDHLLKKLNHKKRRSSKQRLVLSLTKLTGSVKEQKKLNTLTICSRIIFIVWESKSISKI
jgi:hypothetical protein